MKLGDFIYTLRDAKPQRFDVFLVSGLQDDEMPDSFVVTKTKQYGDDDCWDVQRFETGPILTVIRCRAKEDVGKESPVIGTMKGSDER